MDDVLKRVGKRIREIRKAKGLSQEALGERCGFAFSYIGGIERSEKNVTLLSLEKIAEALEVDIIEFFASSKELERVSNKHDEISQIIAWLMHRPPKDIQRIKNIIQEVLDQ